MSWPGSNAAPPPSGRRPAPPDIRLLDNFDRRLLHLLALGAVPRPRSWMQMLLSAFDVRNHAELRPTPEALREALLTLIATGWIEESQSRGQAYLAIAPARWAEVYADLLDSHPPEVLRRVLWTESGMGRVLEGDGRPRYFHSTEAAVANVRLELFLGGDDRLRQRLRRSLGWEPDWNEVLARAVFEVVEPRLFPRLHPDLQAQVLMLDLAELVQRWRPASGFDAAALVRTTRQWLDTYADTYLGAAPQTGRALGDDADEPDGPALVFQLIRLLAEVLVLGEDSAALAECVAALRAEADELALLATLIEAAADGYAGRWADAQAGYESALPALRKLTGQKKGLQPTLLATPYVLALLAQGGVARLQQALKFCLAESGRRQADTDSPWGVMALAIQMRLGEIPRDPKRLQVVSRAPHAYPLDLWIWLMRAWLAERGDADQTALRLRPADEAAFGLLQQALRTAGLARPLAQLEAAHAVLHQQAPAMPFFVPPPQEGWQLALAALAAIGGGELDAAPAKAAAKAEARLWWVLSVDGQGLAVDLQPWEQKMGVRGWGRPKAVPLSRLAKAENLPPQDAALARCIRLQAYERQHRLDLAAALPALLGHPHLAFDDAPELAVTLVEAAPELEVLEHGEDLIVRLNPPPVQDEPEVDDDPLVSQAFYWRHRPPTEQKEREALRSLRVLRDEPQRARLLRYSPAQRRVAQLVGLGLTVPRSAAGQLQGVLGSLGAHFQIQGDQLQAAREVATDGRLRAELTPDTASGPGGLTLRLVVAPLGEGGPRLAPGSGRSRLIAAVAGETLGVQRDLAAELSHLDTVVEACPMLAPLPPQRHPGQVVPALWQIESPDAALALVERLHDLNAVAALDWPKGKAIRVETAGLAQLAVQVHSGTEWLALDGAVKVNEQLVATLSKLLDWATGNPSRFMPLGEGRYLALTEELRARLDELAAVGEALPPGARPKDAPVGNPCEGRWGGTGGGAVRLPLVAAGWLAATLEGAELATDAAWRDRVETLVRAQGWHPELPRTLQATLRPYQVEGYQWAMRLAEAGLGAVLADDMGLGKTLQAVAVMLERAAGGAALVVAPTSLIGNWAAELRRFAPSLTVHVFAEGDREALIEQAGAGEVVLISYQLQLLHSEALAARRWHTLVLDEAQAIKNAAAKRSQAVFELQADFRLALSGTPIENRLAELWALMRVCNPGLLGTPAQFNARFAGPIERDRQTGPRRTLRRLIAPFVLRRTKAQVLDDLPPRTELLLKVQGNETEQAHYEALRRQAVVESHEALSGSVSGQAHFNILAQLTRLRRAACDPRLVTPDLQQPGAKVQAFGELAAELVANGHKALVFSQFVDFLALLREPLDAAGIAYQYLDGSTPAAERSRRVAAFQAGQGELFLISLKAGGFGLNLTVADYVVIADPWWNPAAEDQASGRAHRIGQQRPVTVYRLVNAGTLEERIVALHESKRELADSVLEADGDAAALGPLKADELMDLMLPPRVRPLDDQ
ncbi:MAG: hypothetical protein RL722_577 [Pseudomonadota bacterium]|jgi:superfamily II DNA or RNA helicase